jgi:prepilin-type N-terminal cleavage/methylation domain-containing protein
MKHGRRGFTLIEIMIVVAVIALLAAIAVPAFLRARKRSQATRVINDLRLIDNAIDQYAIEHSKPTGATVAIVDWTNYLKKGTPLFQTGKDILGNSYGPQIVDQLPAIPASTWSALSDVADAAFFWPFKVAPTPTPSSNQNGNQNGNNGGGGNQQGGNGP